MTENEAISLIENLKFLSSEDTYRKRIDAIKLAIQALEEIQQYRAIGTVEEFKDLKEKEKKKKIAYQIGKNGLKHEKCPSCGSFSVFRNYCSWCGQKIDWGKGE